MVSGSIISDIALARFIGFALKDASLCFDLRVLGNDILRVSSHLSFIHDSSVEIDQCVFCFVSVGLTLEKN